MADKDFVVRNGLVVNNTVLVANGTKVGVNTASPDAAFTVVGTSNLQGNTALGGNDLTVTANSVFNGNVVINSNTYFNERIFIGNNQLFVPLFRPVVQAVDNFNGFVQISSQNLANSTSGAENGGTDACSDMVIIGDDSYLGYDKFLDIGYNNSNFDGSYQYLWTATTATNLFVGSTVYQQLSGVNSAVGVLVSKASINSSTWNVVVAIAAGASVAPTAGNYGNLRDVSGNSTSVIESVHRNYPFTISKKNDGYLYVANGALSIGTSEGGRRSNPSDPLYDTSGNPLLFHTNGMLAENEVGRWVGNGNLVVGPSSTSRGAKLTVGGTANIAGQANIGGNVNVTGNVSTVANLYAVSGVFSASVNVGSVGINSSAFLLGNSSINSTSLSVVGSSTVSTAALRSSNLTIGNTTVTDSGLVQVQNSVSSANMSPGTFRAGISTVNTTALSVGANALVNSSAVFVGNASINVTMAQDSTFALRVGGNAQATSITVANLYITNSVVGQANFSGNLAVSGNIVASGNIYAPFSVVASAINVGIVTISTTQVTVGSNVTLDTTGLKITGNTLIASMNVAGGNITVGNNSISNTPTVALTNSTATSNLTPGGLQAGLISINSTGIINVGSNVFINSTALSVGNSSTNLVFNMAGGTWPLNLQANAYVNGSVRIVNDLTVQGTTTYAGTTIAQGDQYPSATVAYDLGRAANLWKTIFTNSLSVNSTSTVGNTSANVITASDSIRVTNSTSFVNVSAIDVTAGNTSVNALMSQTTIRLGNSSTNAVLTSAALVLGNSSVNSTVNSTGFFGNTFGATSNVTTANATTVNATTVNTSTINATSGNFGLVNSSSGNIATMNSSTMTATSVTANVFAITINATSINATSSNSTTVNATTVNATTMNATTIQVGTAFKANSSQVTTANLTVLGNLQIIGTTTFVNTAVMDVTDSNITLAKGALNAAAADGGGITIEGANVSFNYSAASGNWLSNTAINVGNSSINTTINSTSFVGNTLGIHTGNVAAFNISSGNVTTGNLFASAVGATSNVTVGANVLINTSSMVVSNTIAISVQTASAVTVGNSTVTSAPQILVQNTAGVTTINSNFISTTSISGNLSGNVVATNISGNLSGNVTATTIVASANISLGSTLVSNTSGTYATHLGGFPASLYVKAGGGTGGVVALADGGTNSTIAPVAGGVAFGNSTGMALSAAGTSGYFLTSGAAGTPTWTNPATISANTAAYLGSSLASAYQLNSTLAANVITLTANGANYLGASPAANYVQNNDSRTLSGNLYFSAANNAFANQVIFQQTTSQSNTLAAAWFNGATGALSFDTNMTRRISWNDGAGNFNIRSGNFYNGAATIYQSDGTASAGAAAIQLNTDAQDGNIYNKVDVVAADGTTVTFPTYTRLYPNNYEIYANTYMSGNSYVAANATVADSVIVGGRFLANGTVANATHLSGIAAGSYYRINGTDVALTDGGTGTSLVATAGAVAFSNAIGISLTAVGTSGQLLSSAGAGTPTWVSPSALTVASASSATTAATATNQSGGTVSATTGSFSGTITLPSAAGSNYIKAGTSDGASFSAYNLKINSWYGIGFGDYQDLATVKIYMDTRNGHLGLSGGLGVGTSAAPAGQIYATGDITAFYSDARLKTDVKKIDNALEKVNSISGITYVNNELAKSLGYDSENRMAGVLAQEIEAVLPEVVTLAPFDIDKDSDGNIISKSGENYKTVKYDKIVPLLIEAIKELSAKVDSLQSELAELKK